jgi:hypothetical protein
VNPITVTAGILMVGAAIYDGCRGNWKMATIYGCYAVANFVLSVMKG